MKRTSVLAAMLLVWGAGLTGCPDSGGSGVSGDVVADAVDGGDDTGGDVAPDVPGDTAPDTGPQCTTNADCVPILGLTDPCQVALCDSSTGTCIAGNTKDFTPCEDGDACTEATYCFEGSCSGGYNVACDDGNPCTDDACVAASGCKFTPNTAPCDDGNGCTSPDTCSGGACVGTSTAACACLEDADCAEFDDTDSCNGTLACVGGTCQPAAGTVVVCDTTFDTACRKTVCDPASGACEALELDGNACSDGNPCTEGDACSQGVCVGTQTTTGCTCTADADCEDFEDGNLCNGTLACTGGTCQVDPATVVTCDTSGDGQCEVTSCNPATGTCAKGPRPNGTACDDGDACTANDKCATGSCAGTAVTCDDANACTDDTCDAASGCVYTPKVCNDNDLCTDDACDAATGECTFTAKGCDDGDPCTVDTCDTATGTCSSTAKVCDDSDPCTDDACDATTGECTFTAKVCDDADPCTVDTCDPATGACAFTAKACDDADLCTDDACDATTGECTFTPKACDDADLCTVDGCDAATGACTFAAKDCGDGNACTTDACDAATGACVNDAITCTDPDPCTEDLCDPATGCQFPITPGCGPSPCCDPATDPEDPPGCSEDPELETCVCDIDPFCCALVWDASCVNVAIQACDAFCAECGDTLCQPSAGETCETCPEDCGPCVVCGDGTCNGDETCETCPGDCGACPECGDGTCNGDETCETCPGDCGACTECGDGTCDADESCATCPGDCGSCTGDCCAAHDGIGCEDDAITACVCALDDFCCTVTWDGACAEEAFDSCGAACTGVCGDGVCEFGETCETCETDCGACPVCGDGTCEGSETCETCADDCGACPECGDGTCNGDETCSSCADDCGACTGDCCAANDSPGCEDATVTACVCAIDDFCCLFAWDGVCVGLGVGSCGAACFEDCGDATCDDLAGENCGTCPEDCGTCLDGDCCAENGTPGCDDPAVLKCVCAADAFCCESGWDEVCVSEADACGAGCFVCGDGSCDGAETCETCPGDCGACPVCGDGTCDPGEDNLTCPADCGPCAPGEVPDCQGECAPAEWIGDGVCDDSPPGDFACEEFGFDGGDCGQCGNAVCEDAQGETCATCPDDCGACTGACCFADDTPGCEDAAITACICAIDEFCCTSTWDEICVGEAVDECGLECGTCGDGTCELGESCDNCPDDCGECVCGDGACNGDETCETCEGDCGACFCGDGQCTGEETCSTCADDCGACDPQCCEGGGCTELPCLECVCAEDSFCCETSYDGLCAEIAQPGGACADACTCATAGWCGDGTCNPEAGEDCNTCAADCACGDGQFCLPEGTCVAEAVCGDGTCDPVQGEDCNTCADDCACAAGEVCGLDGVCGAAPECGDGVCAWALGETCLGCEADCGTCDVACCEGGSCAEAGCLECICAQDSFCCENSFDSICAGAAQADGACGGACSCSTTGYCGDDTCDPTLGEDCQTCADCACGDAEFCAEDGQCIPAAECGDGTCDPVQGEDCATCADDCGACFCGNGTCDPDEDCNTCVDDCGCEAEETCTTDGQCAAAGDTCETAFLVDTVPFEGTGDTTDASNALSYGEGVCPGVTPGWGAGSPDQVWSFTAETAGDYIITLDATFDSTLYVIRDCADVDGTCVAADETFDLETVTVALEADETVFIVVDGYGNFSSQSGPYTLTVVPGAVCGDAVCEADKGEDCNTCVDDCGCGDGETCDAFGACVTEATCGDGTCEGTKGETCLTCADDCGTCDKTCCEGGSCEEAGCLECVCAQDSFCCDTSFDTICAGIAQPDGVCGVACSCGTTGWCGDETCDPAAGEDCQTCADCACGDEEFCAADGACVPAAVCGDAFCDTVQGETCDTCADDCGACACGNGTCDADEDCNSCVDDCGCTGEETCLPSGQCAGPGDTCETAIPVDALPFTWAGDNTGASNDLDFPAGACPGYTSAFGSGGLDQVFRLSPAATGDYLITQTYDGDYDNVLAVVTDCADVGDTCVAADYSFTGSDELEVNLQDGVVYYIVTDGWGSAATPGTYTLSVTLVAECGDGTCNGSEDCNTCVDDCACGVDEVCDATGTCDAPAVCGDGTCNGAQAEDCNTCVDDCACGPDDTCLPSGACAAPGDVCETAFVVDAVPFTYSGTTAGAANDYDVPADFCPGYTSAFGSGGADQVFAFTPDATGDFIITQTYEGTYDNVLAVFDGCGEDGTVCLGADYSFTGSDELLVTLEGGVTYFILTDNWSSSTSGGAYTLSIVPGAVCGDGTCEADKGEDCNTCADDCGCLGEEVCDAFGACVTAATCGDGTCEAAKGETCLTCESDCGTCDADCCLPGGCEEAPCLDCICAQDAFCCDTQFDTLCSEAAQPGGACDFACSCSETGWCGDGICDPAAGEDCNTCEDCACADGEVCNAATGVCEGPSGCGDGFCDVAGGETCDSCADDCGPCDPTCCEGGSCAEVPCLDCVCAEDSFCCDTAYDSVCAEIAQPGGACEASCSCSTAGWCGDGTCDAAAGEDCNACADDCGCGADQFCDATGACVAAAVCGDGTCDPAQEDCNSCADDCGCAVDDVCLPDGSCVPVAVCGDGTCDSFQGEDCNTCADDCGCAVDDVCLPDGSCVPVAVCGDGTCDPVQGEDCTTCADDCGACDPTCCEGGSCAEAACLDCVCAVDDFCCDSSYDSLCAEIAQPGGACESSCSCATTGWCGDETCDAAAGEDCNSCDADCGCGVDDVCLADGSCAPAAVCGDGTCDPAQEDCNSCADDCGCAVDDVCLPDGSCVPAAVCGDGTCDPVQGEDCNTCADDCGCGVDAVCLPDGQCAPAAVCGDGTCDPAQEDCNTCVDDCGCEAGTTCAPTGGCVVLGDTCDAPLEVGALPFEGGGDTSGAANDYGYAAGACPGEEFGWGAGSPDQAWSFTAPAAAEYVIVLNAGFDSNLYVVTDCGDVDGTCLGADEDFGVESLTLALAEGQTVFIIVDGYGNTSSQTGPYSLSVEAAAFCGDGTCNGDEDCNTCVDDCACGVDQVCDASGACVAPAECGDGTCDAAQGEDCNTCVDDCACDAGSTCTASGVCVADGDTCELPFAVGALPFTAVGDSSAATSDYGYGAGDCPGEASGWGAGSVDEAYAFTPDADGNYIITLDASFDSNLYVVTDCADVAGTCLGASEELGVESLALALTAGTSYFIIVDGYGTSSSQSGPYTLTVEAAGSCGDGTCDAGTGEDCSTCVDDCACAVDQVCDASANCVAAPECGDATCEGTKGETCLTCEADCGACDPTCCIGDACAETGCLDCVCAADDFCCSSSYDDICAELAQPGGECALACSCATTGWCGDGACDYTTGETCLACAGDCGACDANCCVEDDATGDCTETSCVDCVCDLDVFCCDGAWDSICASEAQNDCPDACSCTTTGWCGDGTCDAAGGEDCNTCDADCGCAASETCQADGSCLATAECGDATCNGDETCLTCEADCGACDPTCCLEDPAAAACAETACVDCVCAADSFCCGGAWDEICAGEAQNECNAACSCNTTGWCGDGTCDGAAGEDCSTCEGDCGACPTAGTLFFSEYMEGSSFNKAVEIYNGTGADVDFAVTSCEVRTYFNGASTTTFVQPLTGTLAAGDVLVLCHGDIATTPAVTCDVTWSAGINFNGDDAVALFCDGAAVDIIGVIGVDPAAGFWGTGDITTANDTLRRKCGVTDGDTTGLDPLAAWDPATEFDGLAQNVSDGFGSHTVTCP